MKTHLLAALITLFALCVAYAAETPEYRRLLIEREALLTDIIKELEVNKNFNELIQARLTLYSFRRDTANNVQTKIGQQQLIIQCLNDALSMVEKRQEAGLAGKLDILRAKDRILEAQVLLEQLKGSAAGQ